MFTPKRLVIAADVGWAAQGASGAQPPPAPVKAPGFGSPVSAAEIARWDISIPPSGAGLPSGGGSVKQGESVYAAKCQACKGDGQAGRPARRGNRLARHGEAPAHGGQLLALCNDAVRLHATCDAHHQ